MTQDEIIEMARQADVIQGFNSVHPSIEAFAKLVAQHEREVIARMFEDAPPLVDYVKNDQGGCLICGFTPTLVAKHIRARGQA
jgi:uncharacterized membrane protein